MTFPGFFSLYGLCVGNLGASEVEFNRDLVANSRNFALIMVSVRFCSSSYHPVYSFRTFLPEEKAQVSCLARSVCVPIA